MPDGAPAPDPAGPAADGTGVLSRLSLARGAVDRVHHRRTDQAWLEAAWADEGTRVLVLDHGQALMRFAGDGAALEFTSPKHAPEGVRFLLGVDDAGVAYFGVDGPRGGLGAGPLPGPGSAPALPPEPGVQVAEQRPGLAQPGHMDTGLLRRHGCRTRARQRARPQAATRTVHTEVGDPAVVHAEQEPDTFGRVFWRGELQRRPVAGEAHQGLAVVKHQHPGALIRPRRVEPGLVAAEVADAVNGAPGKAEPAEHPGVVRRRLGGTWAVRHHHAPVLWPTSASSSHM